MLGEAVTRADAPRHAADEDGRVRLAVRRTIVRDLVRVRVAEG